VTVWEMSGSHLSGLMHFLISC